MACLTRDRIDRGRWQLRPRLSLWDIYVHGLCGIGQSNSDSQTGKRLSETGIIGCWDNKSILQVFQQLSGVARVNVMAEPTPVDVALDGKDVAIDVAKITLQTPHKLHHGLSFCWSGTSHTACMWARRMKR